MLSPSPFYRWGNWGTVELDSLPKVTQLGSSRTGIQTRRSGVWALLLTTVPFRLKFRTGCDCVFQKEGLRTAIKACGRQNWSDLRVQGLGRERRVRTCLWWGISQEKTILLQRQSQTGSQMPYSTHSEPWRSRENESSGVRLGGASKTTTCKRQDMDTGECLREKEVCNRAVWRPSSFVT